MVDKNLKELQVHGAPFFPIATYKWYGSDENNLMLEYHWHNEWEFFQITEGCTQFIVNGSKMVLSAGDMAFILGGHMHMCISADGQPYKYKAVVFNPIIIQQLPDDIVESNYIQPLMSGALQIPSFMTSEPGRSEVTAVFDKLFNMVSTKPQLYEMFSKAYLLEIIVTWLNQGLSYQPSESNIQTNNYAKSLKQIISYISANYSSHINVEMLSEMASLSVGHFTRVFSMFTSVTPMQYVINIRLDRASKLLLETNKKLLNISMETGFNNLSYFNRAFKSHFSCTPSQYRKLKGAKQTKEDWSSHATLSE